MRKAVWQVASWSSTTIPPNAAISRMSSAARALPAKSAAGGEAALERLGRTDAPAISAMILDLVMPDLDGMAVLERLARLNVSLPVIVQTTANGADAALSAMRAGAFDFLTGPASLERVRVSLGNALRIGALESEVGRIRRGRAGMPLARRRHHARADHGSGGAARQARRRQRHAGPARRRAGGRQGARRAGDSRLVATPQQAVRADELRA